MDTSTALLMGRRYFDDEVGRALARTKVQGGNPSLQVPTPGERRPVYDPNKSQFDPEQPGLIPAVLGAPHRMIGSLVDSAWNAFTGPGRVYQGKVDPMSDEGLRIAQDIAGVATLGSFGTQVPSGALTSGAARRAPPPSAEAARSIRAYHGSPHDFDQFSLGKIGTGEGAQAYGHGLYFAENEDIARSYRDKLANHPTIDGNKALIYAKDHGASSDALKALEHAKGDVDGAISFLDSLKGAMPSLDEGIQRDIQWLKENKSRLGYNPGHMYEVDIKADPEHFLDWDKPLSEQPKEVLEKLATAQAWPGATADDLAELGVTGEHAYKRMTRNIADDPSKLGLDFYTKSLSANASNALREAGIPGIKYLDAGSRAAGEGSRNYVVFSDELVEIARKYGIPLTFLLGGIGAAGLPQRNKGGEEA